MDAGAVVVNPGQTDESWGIIKYGKRSYERAVLNITTLS